MRVGDDTGMTTCDAPTPPDQVEGRITRSVNTVELTMPPIIGAAIRFLTSAPVPASACRIAYTICSAENFDRFIGPLLSQGTDEAVVFWGDVNSRSDS